MIFCKNMKTTNYILVGLTINMTDCWNACQAIFIVFPWLLLYHGKIKNVCHCLKCCFYLLKCINSCKKNTFMYLKEGKWLFIAYENTFIFVNCNKKTMRFLYASFFIWYIFTWIRIPYRPEASEELPEFLPEYQLQGFQL